MTRFFGLLVFICVLGLGLATPLRALADSGAVTDIRIGTHGAATRFVIDTSTAVPYRAFALNNPPRLVVDLPVMAWQAPLNKGDRLNTIKGYRYGVFKQDTLRLVLDLNRPAVFTAHERLPPAPNQSGWRTVFTITPTDPISFQSKINSVITGGGTPQTATRNTTPVITTAPAPVAVPKTLLTAPAPGKKPLIVIDPGHGGVDPGAIASNGVYEKNITLAVGKALKGKIEATGKYRVMLTRDRDIFIKLPDRVKIARDAGADLFISLHADSLTRPTVQGASVYTLSDTASDAEAAKLAERENAVDSLVGVHVGDVDSDVQDILLDLVTRDTMNQSRVLAQTLVQEFKAKGVTMLPVNPHRSAGFAVLKAPDVPSILIEMGFLSNSAEAEKLASDSHRQKLAKAILGVIDRYFSETSKQAMY